MSTERSVALKEAEARIRSALAGYAPATRLALLRVLMAPAHRGMPKWST
jgi:hypothetical protein